MKYKLTYSEEKNLILKQIRGVNFEDVKVAIEKGKILDEIKHFNQKKYPNQRIMIVEINKYVYAVPYVIDKKRGVIFLKTVYPNRTLAKKYLPGGKI